MGSIDRVPGPVRPAVPPAPDSVPPPAVPASAPGLRDRLLRLWHRDPAVRLGLLGLLAVLLILVGRWSARPEKIEIVRAARPAGAASVQGLPANNPATASPEPAVAEVPAAPSGEIAADIASVDAEIRRAEAEDAKYSGGLVKALVGSEIAILRQTRAMLRHRASSWTFGIGLRYTVDGKPFVPPADAAQRLTAVEAEIATTRQKLAGAEAEAARYSGGLVQALSVSTVATIRNSLAMLEQRRLALKYALPQYIGFQAENAAHPAGPNASGTGSSAPAAAPPPAERKWSIVEIDSRVTETNDTWWRYAWKLTLRNDAAADMAFDATIEFQDSDGFVIDSDNAYRLGVAAGSERTFTGYSLVSMPGGSRVAKTNAKVAPR